MSTDRLTAAQAAERAGVKLGTWTSYVARGQAPRHDGRDEKTGRPYWLDTTITDYTAHRSGQGARTDLRSHTMDDYGTLTNYRTGQAIRRATRSELLASITTGTVQGAFEHHEHGSVWVDATVVVTGDIGADNVAWLIEEYGDKTWGGITVAEDLGGGRVRFDHEYLVKLAALGDSVDGVVSVDGDDLVISFEGTGYVLTVEV